MTPIVINQPIVMQHPSNPDNWILIQPFRYVEDGQEFTIPRGFVYDFASIPRAFWSIISPIELGDVGPLKHDWKYRTKSGKRSSADAAFLKDMKADNIAWWKRTAAYNLVRMWGWMSWGKSKVVIEELQTV